MRVSKFVKPHKDILIEYIYDDSNNISESYKILQNLKNNSLSYISASASITNNTQINQLFQLDPVTNSYGLINPTNYSFLQLRDYSSGFPIRNDIIKVHLPVNYTFGEYLGFYLKVYTFDFLNKTPYTLSSFYFDITNVDQSNLLNFNSPPFLFQEKLWGKNITIHVPSTYAVARQRVGSGAKTNSLNANLSSIGLSLTSPVFLDYHFITQKRTVNSISTYNLTARTPLSLPQAPDFENIGVKIQHSSSGDFFEIYGTFNGDINQFDNFIQDALLSGSKYYVNFTITLFEQNIRGKSFTITLSDNFNERIEYRPIIKFSTTTAIIDVEMNMVDAVDNSSIYRKSSYGMLQDEVAKYSMNFTKINITNASKPKIYSIKSPEGAGIFGNKSKINRNNRTGMNQNRADTTSTDGSNLVPNQVFLEPIKVNYAVLTNMFYVVAKSDNVVVNKDTFYGLGKLELALLPFDNVVKFKIAQDVNQVTTAPNIRRTNQVVAAPKYMDLTGMGEIKMIIKNPQLYFETTLLMSSNEVDLANGVVVFKIPSTRMPDIKKIHASGYNLFYITSSTDTGTIVIYSGLYMIYDTLDNINVLRNRAAEAQVQAAASSILPDPSLQNRRGTAVVTLQQVPTNVTRAGGTASTQPKPKPTSVSSTVKEGQVTYRIDEKSNLIVDGYTFTNSQIKDVLGLKVIPTQLSFKSENRNGAVIYSLYSFNKYLASLSKLVIDMRQKYIKTQADKNVYDSTQASFKNSQL